MVERCGEWAEGYAGSRELSCACVLIGICNNGSGVRRSTWHITSSLDIGLYLNLC
jgi:hypothetical protein